MSAYSFNARYAITDVLATTPEIDWGEVWNAMVFVPAGSPITALTVYCAPAPGGVFLPLYDAATPIAMTVMAGRAYQLPAKIQGCRAIKLVANAAGVVEISFQQQ